MFDKTGTLTTGKSTVAGVISLDEEWHADRVGAALRQCARLEKFGTNKARFLATNSKIDRRNRAQDRSPHEILPGT